MTATATAREPGRRVQIGALAIDPLTEDQVVEQVRAALVNGRGGWIATPNVDHLRRAARDRDLAALIQSASICVADGAPVVWSARLAGRRLPGRVTGADLLWSLSAAAAQDGRTIYLLGGEPGVPERAAAALQAAHPRLKVVGTSSPPFGFEKDPELLRRYVEDLVAAAPDLVFVGLGFPKQERIISAFLLSLPAIWWLGCGAALPFAAGELPRAPRWVGRLGLEWLFRLAHEPRRLFRRYVVEDAPFAVSLLGWALATRLRSLRTR